MPSIKERYILLSACLLLTIPFARVVHEEYSNPNKKIYRVPKDQFANAYWQVKQARLRRNTDSLVATTITLAKLYAKDGQYSVGTTMLENVLEDDAETSRERIDLLAALGDIYRDQKTDEGMNLAHQNYVAAIAEAGKLDNKRLLGQLNIKLINLCYLRGSDRFSSAKDRVPAIIEGKKTIQLTDKIAEELNSKELHTALHNYSAMIELEGKQLGLSDKEKSW